METIKIKKQEEKPLLFSHFTVGVGNATVALVEDGDDLHFGVSLCAPQDMFCRARGRELAKQRLRVHLQRRANGLRESKQAGTIVGAGALSEGLKGRFDRCRTALLGVLTNPDKPQWAPAGSSAFAVGLIQFRTKRKKRNKAS